MTFSIMLNQTSGVGLVCNHVVMIPEGLVKPTELCQVALHKHVVVTLALSCK